MTFEKAIIDAGDSFAPGQVYVALSRLTSLDGLILFSRIHPQAISTDARVLEFSKNEMADDSLQEELQQQQKVFISRSLLQSFSWEKLVEIFAQHFEEYEHRLIPDKEAAIEWAKNMLEKITQQKEVAGKFNKQLEQLLVSAGDDGYQQLHLRVSAAVSYFKKSMDEISILLQKHIKEVKIKQRIKKYLNDLYDLEIAFKRKSKQLQHATELAEALMKGMGSNALLDLIENQKKTKQTLAAEADEKAYHKPKKGETRHISLQLFKEGNKTGNIAKMRGLTIGTIESHLISFISSEEISIGDILSKNKIEKILSTIKENPEGSSSSIKEKLGNDYSYNDIRAVMIWKEMPAKTSQ